MIDPGLPLSNHQLLNVLSLYQSGIAIHYSESSIIQWANDAMIAIWGKDRSVIGKPLEEALPELKGQPFIDMFKKVWREGVTIAGTDTPTDLEINGILKTFYFNFEYKAIKNEHGKTTCILHTATDVTARYLSGLREVTLADELKTINEELAASNEELRVTNEELIESQNQYRDLYEKLLESNNRFSSIVRQAPVGICIINAGNLIVQDVNNAYLEMVGRDRDAMENRQIWSAVPESASILAPVMQEVINTGIPFYGKEHKLSLIRKGLPEQVFIDFVYEPIMYSDAINSVIILGIEVTEKVKARRSIEEAEERSRLAVEAAEIGTFDLNLETDVMVTSDRFNKIFGFGGQMLHKHYRSLIHPDDREKRKLAHKEALKSGKLVYEARVVQQNQSVHWIRVQGKVFYDINIKPYRILGTLLDITKVHRLNQQKDDFINIASHELKTPLTSLKASLQLMERVKDHPSPVLLSKLIDQSLRSLQKISSLVEELLNVSRINESELRLNKTTFTIKELLCESCSHIRAAGKYTLTIQGDAQLKANGDEHAIDQVVVNLVNNAVKYAPDSLEIFLIIEEDGDFAKISVKDHGPGILPDKMPKLFDRYFQVETSGFQNSGLGLGLYICAEIVKRHGGQIGVMSELNVGSTFWFTLPLNHN